MRHRASRAQNDLYCHILRAKNTALRDIKNILTGLCWPMQNLDAVLVEYRMSHRCLQSTIYGLKAKCCRFKFALNRLKELPTVTMHSRATRSVYRDHPLEHRDSTNTITESIILIRAMDILIVFSRVNIQPVRRKVELHDRIFCVRVTGCANTPVTASQ